MTPRHTPGPWTVEVLSVWNGCNQQTYMVTMPRAKSKDEAQANAELIQSAPELFAAIQDLMSSRHCTCEEANNFIGVNVRAVSAITNAEGR